MSYLQNILKEEQDRLHALLQRYLDQLGGLPQGCASIKNRNKIQYLYLAYRKNGKICFEYVGPYSSEQSRAILKKLDEKKKLKEKIKRVNKDLQELKKAFHGKKL